MLSIKEKQDVINPINELIQKVLLKKTALQFEYEKWVDDCIDQNIFSLEGEVPVNSMFNNKNNLIDAIYRDVVTYKDFVVKFLQLDIPTVTFKGCVNDVKKKCADFDERLKMYDNLK